MWSYWIILILGLLFVSLVSFAFRVLNDVMWKESDVRKFSEYNNRYALVIGAMDGVGRAVGLELAEKGMNLFLVDSNSDVLVTTAAEIRLKHPTATVKAIPVDITSEYSIVRIREAITRYCVVLPSGKVDIRVVVLCECYPISGLVSRLPSNIVTSYSKFVSFPMELIASFSKEWILNKKTGRVILYSPFTIAYPCGSFMHAASSSVEAFVQSVSGELFQEGVTVSLIKSIHPYDLRVSLNLYRMLSLIAPSCSDIAAALVSAHRPGFSYYGIVSLLFGMIPVMIMSKFSKLFNIVSGDYKRHKSLASLSEG